MACANARIDACRARQAFDGRGGGDKAAILGRESGNNAARTHQSARRRPCGNGLLLDSPLRQAWRGSREWHQGE